MNVKRLIPFGFAYTLVGIGFVVFSITGHSDASELTDEDARIRASQLALADLQAYLAQPPARREPLEQATFAEIPLTKEDAHKAQAAVWKQHVAQIRQTRNEEMQAKKLTLDNLEMPFFYRVTGDRPQRGRSLYISLHGGGGAPARVNDSQWENQKRLYQIPEGVYLAPRAPTNTWNMWHQGHIDTLFDRLIENLIVFEGVSPNRVYVLGYSAGGDGIYRLAPRMADRWAAAAMMAGHPGGESPINLRNTPFTLHVGGKDSAYNRNEVGRQWKSKLEALRQDDPAGYVHWAKIYEGKGHWLDREDAAAIPWMAQYTRNPLPTYVIWRQDRHPRFYWLATTQLQGGRVIKATREGQTIVLDRGEHPQVAIRLNDRMLNLDEEVRVVDPEGNQLFRGVVPRNIRTIATTLSERGDPESTFCAEVVIEPSPSTLENP